MISKMRPTTNSHPPAIVAENLTKTFAELTAVKELSLTVYPGEIFGLVGPDGAGKSTSLRMLASIMDPDSGSAQIAGFDITKEAAKAKDHLAYMSQKFGLYQDLTVGENIDFYADLYGMSRRDRKNRVKELLDFSNMAPFIQRRAGQLSGGMKQKLQLVCALIHTPKVLLLDEPTNGVDPVSRRDFWRILHKLRQEKVAILLTTAYLDEAERCDRLGLLDGGTLMAVDTPGEIKKLTRGKIISIRSSQARQLVPLLKREMVAANVNLFGDTVHLLSRESDKLKAQAHALLEREEISFEQIREIEPSLEDVFVNLLNKTDHKNINLPEQATLTEPAPNSPEVKNGTAYKSKAVRVKNLSRQFGDFIAVDDLSFEVKKGEIFGFLGPNGAGKSTTIRMLCGLLNPSSGGGEVAGFNILEETEQIKHHIGYMSQKFSLYDDLTVQENISFYGGIYGLRGKRLEERLNWAVTMAGLQEHRGSLTSHLSGGWKQRLALACAILHEPPIVFLDEPTSGVDPLSRRQFWELIYEMSDRGITIFVTTHYMEEAEYCDRIGLIYDGKMIASGSPVTLKTRFMHDRIIDLRCPDPQGLLPELRALMEIRDAALFGSSLHLVVADEQKAKTAILQLLARRWPEGKDIKDDNTVSMETILPSMEDVFISLIEEVDRKNKKKRQQEAKE